MNLSRDFNLLFKEQMVLDSLGSLSDEKFALAVEMYKLRTREAIANAMGLEVVRSVQRMEKYHSLEKSLGVIITEENGQVVVITGPYQDTYAFEIALSAYSDNIKVVRVTPYNLIELQGLQRELTWDSLALFRRYILECFYAKGTDIHFAVVHEGYKVKVRTELRVDGELVQCNLFNFEPHFLTSMIQEVVSKLSYSNSLDVTSTNGLSTTIPSIFGEDPDGVVALRMGCSKTTNGINCTCRLQKQTTIQFKIPQLGFKPEIQQDLYKLSKKTSGITLVTGALRTGKNTTLFAITNEILERPVCITEFSSPVEVIMPFPQCDYANSESNLLHLCELAKKQDVNVILLNEIPSSKVAFAVRDLVNSSIHVLTTMHLDRIWHLPYRLHEYYGEDYKSVISQINACFTQKMYNKLCSCAKTVLTQELEDSALVQYLLEQGVTEVKIPSQCPECTKKYGSPGFTVGGNQPFVEGFVFTEEIKSNLLKCDATYQMEGVLKEYATKSKRTLLNDMVPAVAKGIISPYTLLDVL